MKKTLALLAASAICVLVAATAVSALGSSAAKPALRPATPKGIGPYKIGDTIGSLSKRGLIKKLHPGCELDPGQRYANLKAPLRGIAIFGHGGKRITALSSTAGWETAAGVHVGMPVGKARAAYPGATYIKPKDNSPFFLGFLFVPNSQKTKMAFIVNPDTQTVVQIGIPSLSLCE